MCALARGGLPLLRLRRMACWGKQVSKHFVHTDLFEADVQRVLIEKISPLVR